MLVEAWEFILQHPDRFLAALVRHVELSAAALAIAIAIAVPPGVAFAAKPRAASSTQANPAVPSPPCRRAV